MKNFIFTLFLFVLTQNLLSAQQNESYPNFYYYGTEKITLEYESEKILVKFVSNTSETKQLEILEQLGLKAKAIKTLPSPIVTIIDLEKSIAKNDLIQKLDQLGRSPQVTYAAPFYSFDGTHQTTTNEFAVQLKSLGDYIKLTEFAIANNTRIKSENAFVAGLYILETIGNGDVLSMANKFHESGLFEFAEPNFLRFMQKMTNDPLYSDQWSIENLGNSTYPGATPDSDMDVDSAWLETTGIASIKVAVLDEGVDLQHPDLINNLLPGYDATNQGSNGNHSDDDAHGTACAGIIAAEANNGIGMAGVAYNCKIIPVRIAYSGGGSGWITSSAWISDAINWSWQIANADILSNSWGGGSPSTLITNAFNGAVTQGRNGLGAPVLIAAGNGDGSVSYPATLDDAIAVAAMSMCNERKNPSSCDGESFWGSDYGTTLDIAAPGVKIVATDISGTDGYNSGDYTLTFNGTSSATPNAAGVMALVLSINPALTEDEARIILETTCSKVGNYTYNNNVAGQPNGSWTSELGYGSVNAYAAVQAAKASIPEYCLPTYINLCTSGDYIDSLTFNTIINNGTGCAFPDTSNYSDYKTMVTTVNRGETYVLSVTPSATNGQYLAAFIDFNRDKDFEDAGEFFDLGYAAAGTTIQSNILIPYSADLDTTRLRIMSRSGTTPIVQTDVCVSGLSSGEIEDYGLVIETAIPTISALPDSFHVILQIGNSQTEQIYINNISSSAIPYTINYLPGMGINISSTSGTLAAGAMDSVTVTFSTAGMNVGIYNDLISVIATTPDQTTIHIPSTFEIIDVPSANFTADKTFTCDGVVAFTDASANVPSTWLWDFGDGTLSTLQNPVHLYQNTGYYDVSLKVCNLLGCDSLTQYQYINADINGAFCDTIIMPDNGTIITATSCTGMLYDGGGPNGNYSNNASGTVVIQPTNAQSITLTFNSFQLESCCDYVRIYDGNSVSAPLLGSFNGTNIPAAITSSGGVITVQFTSDGSVTGSGYEIAWQCLSNNCNAPTGLTATNIGVSNATLDWAAAANTSSYNLKWKTVSAGTWTQAGSAVDSLILTTLTGTTAYEYQVQSVCALGGMSAYSSLATFSTNSAFDITPDSLFATLIAGDSTTQQIYITNQTGNTINYQVDALGTNGIYNGNFESGTSNLTLYSNNTLSFSVTNNNPASGNYCLEITGGNYNTYQEGAYYDFGQETPNSIDFDFRLTNTNSHNGSFVLMSGGFDVIAFRSSYGAIGLNDGQNGSYYGIPNNTNQWYNIEFNNIDYNNNTFDFYIDGNLVQAGVNFMNPVNDFDRFNVYNYEYGISYFDNITIGEQAIASTWMNASPSVGSIPANQTDSVGIEFNSTNLATGIYTGTVNVSTAFPDSSSKSVFCRLEVIDVPNTDFGATATYSCNGQIDFIDLTANVPNSWSWDFGDGNLSTAQNPTHIYQNSGFYDISLISCNALGCDTIIKNQYIEISINGAFCDTLIMATNNTLYASTCTGVLYDDGGADNNYNNYGSGIVVISPINAQSVQLTFNSFDLMNFGDFVNIYDGNSPSAPLLGSFNGTSIPPILTSSGSSITIQLSTNSNSTAAGFEMLWQCVSNNCTTPTGLSETNINVGDATLNWTALTGSNSYDIEWRASGLSNWSQGATASNSFGLTNLVGGTTYEWRVLSNCTAGALSAWSVIDTFTTLSAFSVTPDSLFATLIVNDSTTQQIYITNQIGNTITYEVDEITATYFYANDFESGASDLTLYPNNTLSFNVNTNNPASGNYSLEMLGGNYNYLQEGAYYDLAQATPSNLSFDIRVDNQYSDLGYFILMDGTTDVITFSAEYLSLGVYDGITFQRFDIMHTQNQWYHIELKNMDYVNHTYDLYIDENLIQTGINFSSAASSFSNFRIFNYNYGIANFDNIVLEEAGTALAWLNSSTAFGAVPANQTDSIAVEFNSTGLATGIYTGIVKVSSATPDSTSKSVFCRLEVIDIPNTAFEANTTYSCDGQINFTDLTANVPNNWTWDFGDGNIATTQNPTHIYQNSGFYDVSLITCNALGCDTLTKLQYIDVSLNGTFCDSISMPNNGTTITATTCTGMLYDDGGANGDYTNSAYGIVVIQPINAQSIMLTLNNINFYSSSDYINVYDGNSTNAPYLATINSFSNFIQLFSTGGTLTLEYYTNSFGTNEGFEIAWQCVSNNCGTATGLTTTNIGVNQADLNWNNNTNAVSYEIEWREIGGSWQDANAAINTQTLSNLVGNTTYEWRVFTNCTAGDLSDWSAVSTFTTNGAFIVTPDSLHATLIVGDSTTQQLYITNQLGNTIQYEAVSGTAIVGLFHEDFENGNYDSLTTVSSNFTYNVTTNNPSSGQYALEITGGNNNHYQGLMKDFGVQTPSQVSFDVKPGSASSADGYFVIGNDPTSNDGVMFFNCTSVGMGVYSTNAQEYRASYNANQWYHVEFSNIDYTAHTFDFYVDGILVQGAIPFRNNDNALQQFYLYNFNNSTATYDNIIIGNGTTAVNWLSANSTGNLNSNATDSIPVQFNATGLATGTYQSFVTVSSNSPDSSNVRIPCILDVIDVPNTNFSASTTYSCDGIIQFNDLTQNVPNSWVWDFGDGNISTAQNPIHAYTLSGIYDVSLIACNALGCDTFTRVQYIDVNINGAFCDTLLMPIDGSIITATSCTGILYDNGGANGNYFNNVAGIVVIEPTNAQNVTINFTSFQLEGCCDYVGIYDGNSISAPLLGAYNGSGLPPSITSTGNAITVQFTSDGSVTYSGFELNWQCTVASCDAPIAISANNITYVAASLLWNNVANVANYDMSWRPNGTTNWTQYTTSSNSYYLNNLTPGTNYEWRVKTNCNNGINDGWSAIDTFTTLQAIPLSSNLIATNNPDCYGNDSGVIDIDVIGSAPFSYNWSNGATTQDLNNLLGGTYTCTITDAANQTITTNTFTIVEPTQLATTNIMTAVSCNGFSDGTIALNTTGGTTGYNYLWSNNSTNGTLTNVVAGNYTCTITDANNCILVTESILISEPTAMSMTETIGHISCNGEIDGHITIHAVGGVGNYTYSWSDNSTDSTVTSLSAGNYTCTITDMNNCTMSTNSMTITEPAILELTDTVITADDGSNNGAIDITINGGVTPYQFNWSNGATTEDIDNIERGVYTLTLTDANGCETIFTFDITVGTAAIFGEHFNLNVYPNPIRQGDWLQVDMNKTFEEVTYEIHNLLGQKIDNGNLNLQSQQAKVKMPEEKGVYMMTLYVEGVKAKTFKILVK